MDPQELINIIGQLRLPLRITKLITNIAGERTVNFYRNGKKITSRKIKKGAAQGRVSSPIAFNTYISDIDNHIGQKCTVGMYADDAGLYTVANNEQECTYNLEDGLRHLQPWLEKIKLKISKTKTKFMILSRKKRLQGNTTIRIDNAIINRSDTARFLGVTLDTKMKWKPFINEVKRNITRSVDIMKTLARKAWGAHPTTLLQVYKGLTRARADWACFCTQSACQTLKKEIERGQNAALRVVLGCFPSTPAVVLRDLANQPTAEIRGKILTSRFLARTFTSKSHPLNQKLKEANHLWERKQMTKTGVSFLHKIWREEEPDITNLSRSDKLPCFEIPLKPQLELTTQNFDIGKRIKKKESNAEDFTSEIAKNRPNWTIIYTDASKTKDDKYIGFAFTCSNPKMEKKFKISSNFSIAEGEALAILQSLKTVKNMNINKLLICTDSASTLEALNHIGLSGKTSPIILEIKSLISRLKMAGRKTELWWCPSHLGIEGNEKADELANEARLTGELLELKPNYTIYSRTIQIKYKTEDETIRHEDFKKSGSTYHKFNNPQPNNSKKAWFENKNLKESP
ncbi:uncharacterized protein LOC141532403 [Cotesia typhae]|uniref:uncharacterized protein LOC141532403 n=1 Tax=Cotesia typhae TaxID=2053667 RepID=UPI003D693AEC